MLKFNHFQLKNITSNQNILFPNAALDLIGHFRVPKNLTFKTRLSAKPLIWKWFLILMQIKLIFTTQVSHLASFWKWDVLELGSGLLITVVFSLNFSDKCCIEATVLLNSFVPNVAIIWGQCFTTGRLIPVNWVVYYKNLSQFSWALCDVNQAIFSIIKLMIAISHQLYTNMENLRNVVGVRWLWKIRNE